MTRLFVSYRREDSSGHAGRLIDRLREQFGTDSVFMDVDNIAVGLDFGTAIREAVRQCNVLLVVIGRSWLDCRDTETGARRLDSPEDWVRIEIVEALDRGVPVVPVLVQGAQLPRASELPQALGPLSTRNAAMLIDSHWDASVADLVRRLRRLPGVHAARSARVLTRRVVRMAAVFVIGAALVIAAVVWRDERVPDGRDAALPHNQGTPTPASTPATQPPVADSLQVNPGLFERHPVVGGWWYEMAFNAYIAFRTDGSITGTYYQHLLSGRWTPLSEDRLIFTASFADGGAGTVLQWEPGMIGRVQGNTLELRWPTRKTTDYLVRKAKPPQ